MSNKTGKNVNKLLAIGILLPLLAIACQAVIPFADTGNPLVSDVTTAEPQAEVAPSEVTSHVESMSDDSSLVDLYRMANPAVVNITLYTSQGGLFVPSSQGSGFVVDGQGHIVTNAHVVHGADEIEVTFSDGTVRPAELIGEDLNSDLAVIQVSDVPSGVEPLPLGDMNTISVGQTAVAIGNPFGLEGTLTRGIISSLGRTIPALTPFSIPESIQTDAAINPGNSGGPLLNLQGEVIGVNAQIETGGNTRSNLGVGFAIPVSIVQVVVPDLIEKGKHEWAWLGVRGSSLTPWISRANDAPVEKGAYLAEVLPDGPSDVAGLIGGDAAETIDGRRVPVGGDVIVAIDGQPVNSFDDLLVYIALGVAPGQEVNLTIYRQGEKMEIPVTLENRPVSLEQGNP